jgi:hypothetical protein
MSKTALLLFARIESNGNISPEINETIESFKQLNTTLDIHLVAFGVASKNIVVNDDVNFSFYENLDINFFQSVICSKLELFLAAGHNKTIISSCSYQINNKNFLDKNLVIVTYDGNEFNENKNINHRFIYGRTALLKRIWENKPFDAAKDLDKNLFLNVFNVIGLKNMNENKVPMNGFIKRIGWHAQ